MDHRYSLQALSARLQQAYRLPLPARVLAILELAYEAHAEQLRDSVRKDERLPYIVHPVGTALLCLQYYAQATGLADDLETIICIALAHDLLEDTRVEATKIERLGGRRARVCTEALTKPPSTSAGRDSEERSKEFAAAIVRAGRTAVFVKICDSLHNLSRPRYTPLRLLRKLISKARRHYLPMLDECDLGETLRTAFEAAIENASDYLESAQDAGEGRQPKSLEAALTACVASAIGKTPEPHDICLTLKEVCGLAAVSVWASATVDAKQLNLLAASDPMPPELRLGARDEFRTSQASSSLAILLDSNLPPSLEVLAVPVSLSAVCHLLFVLAPTGPDDPPWLSPEVAEVMVRTLAQRLIAAEEDKRAHLAGAAAKLGMKMDVEVGMRVGVTPGELSDLAVWHSRCLQAISAVRHLIESFFLIHPDEVPLTHLVRVESRLKGIDSTLAKFLGSREMLWPSFGQLEDIAGIRVVCPTQAGVDCLDRFLQSADAVQGGIRLSTQIRQPRRDYTSEPTLGGYRSLHLILDVETSLDGGGEVTVPCEVQLRTMLQHTWAAISHATAYKSTSQRGKQPLKLRQMAQALLECDELADEIVRKSL